MQLFGFWLLEVHAPGTAVQTSILYLQSMVAIIQSSSSTIWYNGVTNFTEIIKLGRHHDAMLVNNWRNLIDFCPL